MQTMFLALLAGMLTGSSGDGASSLEERMGPAQQTACPAETERSRRIVERFGSSDEAPLVRAREHYALPQVAANALRPLVDERDADACKRLHQFVRTRTSAPGVRRGVPWLPSFYSAGDHYYVVLDKDRSTDTLPPGRIRLSRGFTPLYILDRQFTLVGSPGM